MKWLWVEVCDLMPLPAFFLFVLAFSAGAIVPIPLPLAAPASPFLFCCALFSPEAGLSFCSPPRFRAAALPLSTHYLRLSPDGCRGAAVFEFARFCQNQPTFRNAAHSIREMVRFWHPKAVLHSGGRRQFLTSSASAGPSTSLNLLCAPISIGAADVIAV